MRGGIIQRNDELMQEKHSDDKYEFVTCSSQLSSSPLA